MNRELLAPTILIIFALVFVYWLGELSLRPLEGKGTSLCAASILSGSKVLRIPILIYHSVHSSHPGENKAQLQYNVTPELFEQQLAYLSKNDFAVLSLDQVMVNLDSTSTLPIKKSVVITFDDGWQNQYANAWPILKKYGYTATFYIYTNPIGRDDRFLTWDEIREMSASGMTIGSHSVYHPYFSTAKPEELRKEIFDSKKKLEAELGQPVIHFATPFGYTNSKIESLIGEAGYVTNRITKKGSTYKKEDVLHFPGYFATQDMAQFEWIVNYGS